MLFCFLIASDANELTIKQLGVTHRWPPITCCFGLPIWIMEIIVFQMKYSPGTAIERRMCMTSWIKRDWFFFCVKNSEKAWNKHSFWGSWRDWPIRRGEGWWVWGFLGITWFSEGMEVGVSLASRKFTDNEAHQNIMGWGEGVNWWNLLWHLSHPSQ